MERTYERETDSATGNVYVAVGRLVATAGAVNALLANQIDPYKLLRDHERGDYGVLSERQREANAAALRSGGRILSVHALEGDALWIITERGRRTTNLMLQSEILDCQDQEHEYE